jgi:hypothetical protein
VFDKPTDVSSVNTLQPSLSTRLQVHKKAQDGGRVRSQRVGPAVAPVKLAQVPFERLKAAQAPLGDLLKCPADNLLLASQFVAVF